jgi:hypothetical protein
VVAVERAGELVNDRDEAMRYCRTSTAERRAALSRSCLRELSLRDCMALMTSASEGPAGGVSGADPVGGASGTRVSLESLSGSMVTTLSKQAT